MYDLGRVLVILLALLLAPPCFAQQPLISSLEAAMGQEQFKKAGLDKLSPEELAQLERWVTAHTTKKPVLSPVNRPIDNSQNAANVPQPATAATQDTRQTVPAAPPLVAAPSEEGFGLKRAKRRDTTNSISSHIDGDFRGWTGKTIFKLQNGQVWIQRIKGKSFVRLNNPEVAITRNMLGYYKMTIVETGRAIGVKRIK